MAGRKATRRPKLAPNTTSVQRADLEDTFSERAKDIAHAHDWRTRRRKAQTAALAALAAWRETIVDECAYERRMLDHVTELARIIGGVVAGAAPSADQERERLEAFDLGVGFIRESELVFTRELALGPQEQVIAEAESFLDDPGVVEVVSERGDNPDDRLRLVRKTLTKLRQRGIAWPVAE